MPNLTFSAREVADPASASSQCAVIPLFSDKKSLPAEARAFDRAGDGAIKAALALGDFSARKGQTLFLPGAGGARRMLLVGCGQAKKFDRAAMRGFCADLYGALKKTTAGNAMLHLGALGLGKKEACWFLAYLARHLTTADYRYRETLSEPKPALKLTRFTVNPGGKVPVRAAGKALKEGRLTGLGINDARERKSWHRYRDNFPRTDLRPAK